MIGQNPHIILSILQWEFESQLCFISPHGNNYYFRIWLLTSWIKFHQIMDTYRSLYIITIQNKYWKGEIVWQLHWRLEAWCSCSCHFLSNSNGTFNLWPWKVVHLAGKRCALAKLCWSQWGSHAKAACRARLILEINNWFPLHKHLCQVSLK